MTLDEACPIPLDSDAPDDATLRDLLSRTRSVAVVGASPNPDRTSHQIAQWLMRHTPYTVYLVNPAADGLEIDGHPFFPDLSALPEAPDMVDVFRRAEHTPAVAHETVAIGAQTLWLQLGIRNDEAAGIAADAGLAVVQNRCLKVEYARLIP